MISQQLIFIIIFIYQSAVSEDVPVLDEVRRPIIDYSTASMCPFDCKPEHCRPVVCPSGIQSQWDGCRCCMTCPRGQGDMCDYQHPCADTLNCVFNDGTENPGICRSNKTCRLASGRVLQDGETFQPHCSMQCSCQGGLVGCASLCHGDERNMAFAMKSTCQRVRVPNSCCPQWVCDHMSSSMLSALFFRKGMIEPDSAQLSVSNTLPTTTTTTPITSGGDSNEKVEVEYVAPLIVLHQQEQPARTSKMRSLDSSAPTTEPSVPEGSVTDCTGTSISLRSCSLNKCGLRLTDDFVGFNLTCPAKMMPKVAYCMFRPCTKKRRQDPCTPNSVPLTDFELKVRHSGCRTHTVAVKYCKSCKSTTNRCCLPASHNLVAYNQSCFDGTVRKFYVAQATACSCRSDVFRHRDCQLLYQKMLNAALPPQAKVFQRNDDLDKAYV